MEKLEKEVQQQEDKFDDLIEKIARRVVEWRLSVPAIVMLESSKPLSFLASQLLVFFDPIVKSFLTVRDYDRFVEMLEDRSNIERLIQRIEELEDQWSYDNPLDENVKSES
ncbi:MAG: hypothetical protein DRQ10_03735 [Candidatus Hydrothermota bacterium]|nr:MAG: hypothetical protein DRQ10_03735 [Candidatus Hydrothermae bacterium]